MRAWHGSFHISYENWTCSIRILFCKLRLENVWQTWYGSNYTKVWNFNELLVIWSLNIWLLERLWVFWQLTTRQLIHFAVAVWQLRLLAAGHLAAGHLAVESFSSWVFWQSSLLAAGHFAAESFGSWVFWQSRLLAAGHFAVESFGSWVFWQSSLLAAGHLVVETFGSWTLGSRDYWQFSPLLDSFYRVNCQKTRLPNVQLPKDLTAKSLNCQKTRLQSVQLPKDSTAKRLNC